MAALPNNLIPQLRLALSLISGRRSPFTTNAADKRLLGDDLPIPAQSRADEEAVLEACEQIVLETILACIPEPALTPEEIAQEMRADAIYLLRLIEQHGGVLSAHDAHAIGVPDEFVNQLEKDGILIKTLSGLRFGRFARKALEDNHD